ncbi:MAG TPA: FAD-dependent oxidoreductase [Candidatus Nanoarchaeia archaeon]|nr:FAD-dependent oxidoreductase [Candidatus Nanoarchaeia archaeon]
MKVLIVGGGFGGVKAALELSSDSRFDVTLISDKKNFEYHAALYRSATGRSPLEVVIPLDEIFASRPNIEVVQDKVVELDIKAKQVTSADGCEYHYDALILAMGVVTEYYGIHGLPEFSYGIKSINEALELKRHLHDELTEHELDSHFVIIGGGPTGVELSGDLVHYLKKIEKAHKVTKKFQVNLVEAAPRLLPVLPEDLSNRVEQHLAKLGVKVQTGAVVQGEKVDSLMLPEGDIKTHTVVWTAGVTNNPFFKAHEKLFRLSKGNRVEVDDRLQAAPDVYVIGDSAFTKRSGMAQTALYDAKFVANNLKRQLKGQQPTHYRPRQPIGAIPVGPKWAAVADGNKRYYGRRGWRKRRWLDLKLYLSFLPRKKAIEAWRQGNQIEESCPVCAGS